MGVGIVRPFVIFVLFINISSQGEPCGEGENQDSCDQAKQEKNKYKEDTRWSHYLQKIKKAVEDYSECTQDDCSCHMDVMDRDLSIWKDGISKADFDSALNRNVGTHYQIINHKLYRDVECNTWYPCRCKGVEYFLLRLLQKLPDMELLINCLDLPQSPVWQKAMPVFSFSKPSEENHDIMYPAWTFWEGGPKVRPIYPNGLGRWDEQRKIIPSEAAKWPWEKKKNQGFFRGSRSSSERDPLVLLSRSDPHLVDAQYTKKKSWKSKDTLGEEPAKEIKLEEHCKWKYLFNIRGKAASFRFKHLFLCGSLVFHVGDEWLEFFYPAMKPWVHYIPVPSDLSNVRELLEFVRENDDVAKEISERGRKFIMDHLRMEDVECYWLKLLKRYAKLTMWKPKRDKKLMQITSSTK